MTPVEYMQRAIRLAARGFYTTDPNPRVGCVIVDDDGIAGEGWHQRYGEAHAEVIALRAAGDRAHGATAYVTLEPCNHTGKTPPCVDVLIDAGVSRVVAAMQDPNPLVAGKGLQRLAENGIDIEVGLLEQQAKSLNPGFIKRMETGYPFVRVKLAMSLDGRTAMADGESRWISSEQSRIDVQRQRARSSVILTGRGTLESDDPRLDVRISPQDLGVEGSINRPLRAVVSSRAKIRADASIRSTEGDIIVYTLEDGPADDRVEYIKVDAGEGGVDLEQVLKDLASREANEVLVEAGAGLCGALLSAELVDEVVLYMAPHIMGDAARGLFHMPGLSTMKDRIGMNITDTRQFGEDIRITMSPIYRRVTQ